MKTRQLLQTAASVLASFFILYPSAFLLAAPLGTEFNYQGKLAEGGNPATGSYDLKFTLYDAQTGPAVIGGPITNAAVALSNGLFGVTLDFGPAAFNGDARWLEIGVRSTGLSADFTVLSPRTEVSATPYASYSPKAGQTEMAKAVADGAITAVKIADKAIKAEHLAPGAVTAEAIADGAVTGPKLSTEYVAKAGDTMTGTLNLPANGLTAGGNQLVLSGGNVGIGTATPATALDVNGEVRVWSLNQPNVWGGVAMNATWDGASFTWRRLVDGHASLMQQSGSDGGLNWSVADSGSAGSPISWRYPLRLTRDGDMVVDWAGANTNGTLSGGLRFGWSGSGEGIASKRSDGGNQWGLDLYTANQPRLSIANNGNVGIGTNAPQSTLHVAGTVTADNFAGSGAGLTGISAAGLADGSITSAKIGAGAVGATQLADGAVTGPKLSTAYVAKAGDTMTGGLNLPVNGLVAGGNQLVLSGGNVGIGETNPSDKLVVGEGGNLVLKGSADDAGDIIFRTSTGTQKGRIFSEPAAGQNKLHLTSGDNNADLTIDATGNVGIGTSTPTAKLEVAGTVRANAVEGQGTQPLEFFVSNQRALRLEPNATSPKVVGGFAGNWVAAGAYGSTIAGGGYNQMTNSVSGNLSTIGGGAGNTIGASSSAATIAGGNANVIGANCNYSVIGGGSGNSIPAGTWFGTIPGGYGNTATNYAFAAGFLAKANHPGSFVWADQSGGTPLASTANNQFLIRASGGVGINTAMPQAALDVNGTMRAQTVTITSDRAAKQDFAPVDTREILQRLVSMPVQTWAFKDQAGIRHLGPVAQDFYAAFAVGEDNRHIATVDADGAALAAIQGLYQMVKEKDAEIDELKRRIGAMESALASGGKITGTQSPSQALQGF